MPGDIRPLFPAHGWLFSEGSDDRCDSRPVVAGIFFFNITKPALLHYAPPQSVSAMNTSSGSFVDEGICQMGSNKLFCILRRKEGKGTEAFDCRPCVS